MVLVLILDAVGHHQIGVLRWHDRLQGAWAFVIRHWDCHGSGATELYWVLVHTLFKRIIREELYYLAVSTSKSTSTLSSTPVHPYHRHLAPVVSLALRGKEKKDASEHLQKRAQTRASEHLSATSATTLVGVAPHDQPSSPGLHRGRRLGFSVDFFVPTSNVGCGPTPRSNFTRRGFYIWLGDHRAMGDAANLLLVVKPGFWDCGWMAPTVGFNRVGLPGGGLFFAAVVQG